MTSQGIGSQRSGPASASSPANQRMSAGFQRQPSFDLDHSNPSHGRGLGSAAEAVAVAPLTYSMSDIVKQARVQKLGSEFVWKSKRMLLSQDSVWFTADEGERTAPDCIALHEIASIRPCVAFGKDLTSFHEKTNGLSQSQSNSVVSPNGSDGEPRTLLANMLSMGDSRKGGRDINGGSFHSCCFDIVTTDAGLHSGRIYTVKMESSFESEEWVQLLNAESRRRIREVSKQTKFDHLRYKVRVFYHHPITQTLVGSAIVGNFVAVAIQAQNEPMAIGDPSQASRVYEDLDLCLTMFFAVELGVNLFGHWFWEFVYDPWSLFDTFVVSISVVSLMLSGVPGISVLRVLRAFRILRVIKRFESLLRITNAIFQSAIPVLNALIILLMVTAIYAIMGVFLFADQSDTKFGNFGRSMYTMFELLAFAEWRGMPVFEEVDGELQPDVSVIFFLTSFMAIGSWTLLQVVVAVLLDNFIAATEGHKLEREIKIRAANRKPGGAIDPLLEKLSSSTDTEKELEGTISVIWKLIDEDGTGSASYEQMRQGLLKLNVTPRIRLSEDDFAGITEGFALCDGDRAVSAQAFSSIITRQLRIFLQRKVSEVAAMSNMQSEAGTVLQGVKQLLMSHPHDVDAPAPSPSSAADADSDQDRSGSDSDAGVDRRQTQRTRRRRSNGRRCGETGAPSKSEAASAGRDYASAGGGGVGSTGACGQTAELTDAMVILDDAVERMRDDARNDRSQAERVEGAGVSLAEVQHELRRQGEALDQLRDLMQVLLRERAPPVQGSERRGGGEGEGAR